MSEPAICQNYASRRNNYREIKLSINWFLGDGLNHFWISGTKLPDVNEWIWFTTGRHITYFNWNSGEPNNAKKDEYCIEMRVVKRKVKWNDIDCWQDFNFICEFTWTKDCIKLLKDIQHRSNISNIIDVGWG